jgi:hypothetical protein
MNDSDLIGRRLNRVRNKMSQATLRTDDACSARIIVALRGPIG